VPQPLAGLLHAVRDSREVIRLKGLIGTALAGEPPTIDADGAGIAFARAALRTWP
jgi:hypothetical protein